ncbi:MAG TPA: NAD(+)/NADH kinase [Terriglobia bacterium]|nr:NAD(+)/NADH kinase [Terriglobia bacterium]
MPIQKVGITSKPRKPELKEIVPPLARWLQERNLEVLLDKETGANIETSDCCLTRNEIATQADLVVVLGGDGTLLATARAVGRRPVPILAVNLGALGFLTVITLEELYPTLEMVLAGNFRTEQRVRVLADVIRNQETIASFLALNDVVLNKGAIARVLDFDVRVDDQFVSTYKSDGLIVSTPTGSTAYSLAAGGPVIVPTVNAFIVTPICAHALTNRAVVLPDSVTVEVAMKSHQESVYLTIDGQVAIALRSDDLVRLKKASSFVELIQPPHKTYYEILRQKLKWGER